MKTKVALGLLLALQVSACAFGPKKRFTSDHPERLQKVKTVAVLGFDVSQESTGGMLFDTNIAGKALGNYSGKGSLQYDPYAEEILNNAIHAIEQQTGWKVIPIKAVVNNPVYKSIYDKKMNNWAFSTRNQGGADGDLKYGFPGMLLGNQIFGQGMGAETDRHTIMDELKIDGALFLLVDYRLPYDGFKIGSLVGSGSGSHKPETSVHMWVIDRDDKFIGSLNSKKNEKMAAKAGPELKKLMVESFKTTFGEGLIEIKGAGKL
jgi:hypothetical protein